MPAAQIVNLNQQPVSGPSALEKTLSAFTDRFRQNQREDRETDALRDIYQQYQQDGQNIDNTILRLQTERNISPTARVNGINQMMGFRKHNSELQKQAKEASEEAEKKASRQGQLRHLEKLYGLQPHELDGYEENPALALKAIKPDKTAQDNQWRKDRLDFDKTKFDKSQEFNANKLNSELALKKQIAADKDTNRKASLDIKREEAEAKRASDEKRDEIKLKLADKKIAAQKDVYDLKMRNEEAQAERKRKEFEAKAEREQKLFDQKMEKEKAVLEAHREKVELSKSERESKKAADEARAAQKKDDFKAKADLEKERFERKEKIEKDKADAEREDKKKILRYLEEKHGLEENDLDGFEFDVKLAEQISKPATPPRILQSDKAITPEQREALDLARQDPEYEEADEYGKYKLLTGKFGVSAENSDKEIEAYSKSKGALERKEGGKIRQKQLYSYIENAFSEREQALGVQEAIESVSKAIKGDITGPGVMAVLKHDPFGQLFFGQTVDEAALDTAKKKLLEGSKGIFGSQITEREVFILLNGMFPAIGKSREANEKSLEFVDRLNQLKIKHGDLVDKLTKGGAQPIGDLESRVAKEMKEESVEFLRDVKQFNEAQKAVQKAEKPVEKAVGKAKRPDGTIAVRAPNGKLGYMTQEQIDAAKAKNVIFTPE